MNLQEIKQNKERFLQENDLYESFIKSKLNWNQLMAIADDFESKRPEYEELALQYVKRISDFDRIHSVKYRIKKTDSFIKKIIAKTCDGLKGINTTNYMVKLTDLIGIRVLYIFKSDYLHVHNQIIEAYFPQMTENVHVKLREGDDAEIYADIRDAVIEPNAVYRSIHYTLRSREENNSARMEIQTRTLFEEGWSEINHRLVYKNESVAGFTRLSQASRILSSLAGDCDTLGNFMKDISDEFITRLAEKRIDYKKIDTKTEILLSEVMSDIFNKT